MKTAEEQFIDDYTIVIDNDHDGYRDEIYTAEGFKEDVYGYSQYLRNEWDEYIDQVAELCANNWGADAPATLLVRQMMGGWGDSAFYQLAKHYMDLAKEAK
jgi:hypothetical protein